MASSGDGRDGFLASTPSLQPPMFPSARESSRSGSIGHDGQGGEQLILRGTIPFITERRVERRVPRGPINQNSAAGFSGMPPSDCALGMFPSISRVPGDMTPYEAEATFRETGPRPFCPRID